LVVHETVRLEKQIPKGNDRKKSKSRSHVRSDFDLSPATLAGAGFGAGGWGWVVGLAAGGLEDGWLGVGFGG